MTRLTLLRFPICLLLLMRVAGAAAPGGLAQDGLHDTRLGPLKGEQGDFLLKPAGTIDEARRHAARVRRVMLVTMGLWPMPERTPLNAVVHGKLAVDDYTIEKVYFESYPGFFVTGNLYRPTGRPGRLPAVLSPHGHFPGGRFQDEGQAAARKKIEAGAERFEDGGRSFMQSRCVQLARMGCVVFHYDMVGYGDSQQIPLDLAHRFSGSRLKFNRPPESGFYSAPALLNINNQLGLHTWNSIRALDFLTSLADVDPDRVAVTGGSGGGTQTFMLCAVDERPLVSVPVVIVSADRQGGCTCENICGLRIDTSNLDFTALHAPKPLLLISADDATRTMSDRGFPELRQHYQAWGAGGKVEHVALTQFPHNYNYVSRNAMYHFVNRHLKLGLAEPIIERPYRRLSREQLSVWDDSHPAPARVPDFDRLLLDQVNAAAGKQLAALRPRDARSLETYRAVVGAAWDVLLRSLPREPNVRFAEMSTGDHGNHTASQGTLSYRTMEAHHAALPAVILKPANPTGRTVIWISETGKAGLFEPDGKLRTSVQQLLDGGRTVMGVDLLSQGELTDTGGAAPRQRSLPGEEGYGGWTYCYNLPLFARRVHDILAVIQFAQQSGVPATVDIAGLDKAGPLVAAAVVQSAGQIDRAAIVTGGFRFAQLKDVYDARFLPGAVKYGDLPGLLSLAAPANVWLAGEPATDEPVIAATWRASGQADRLTVYAGDNVQRDAVRWLLR